MAKRLLAIYRVETPYTAFTTSGKSVGNVMHQARKDIGRFTTRREGRIVQKYPQPRSNNDGSLDGVSVSFVRYFSK